MYNDTSTGPNDIIDFRIHWIPVECLNNFELARLSPMADVWAFATTLWEIFSYSDYTNKINEINRIFTKKVTIVL